MQYFIDLILLLGLSKLLDIKETPLLPAFIFAAASFMFNVLFNFNLALSFGLSWVYYYLLQNTRGSKLWWVVLMVGGLSVPWLIALV